MKKLIYLFIAFAIIFTSCGKKDEVKKDEPKKEEKKEEVKKDDAFKDLKYGTSTLSLESRQAKNSLYDSARNQVYDLGLYKSDYVAITIQYYKEKFMDKYPMWVKVDEKGDNEVELFINERYTVWVYARGGIDNSVKGYDKPELVKKLISLFDLEGISKLPTDNKIDNLEGKDFAKFLPKFETWP